MILSPKNFSVRVRVIFLRDGSVIGLVGCVGDASRVCMYVRLLRYGAVAYAFLREGAMNFFLHIF